MPAFLNSLINRFKGQEKNSVSSPDDSSATTPVEPARYKKIIEAIEELIINGTLPGLQKKEDMYSVSFYFGTRRIFNINKITNPPKTFFFYSGANLRARELNRPGLRAISRNEAKQKGYGHAKAIYSGTDTEIILDMLKNIRN